MVGVGLVGLSRNTERNQKRLLTRFVNAQCYMKMPFEGGDIMIKRLESYSDNLLNKELQK